MYCEIESNPFVDGHNKKDSHCDEVHSHHLIFQATWCLTRTEMSSLDCARRRLRRVESNCSMLSEDIHVAAIVVELWLAERIMKLVKNRRRKDRGEA